MSRLIALNKDTFKKNPLGGVTKAAYFTGIFITKSTGSFLHNSVLEAKRDYYKKYRAEIIVNKKKELNLDN